MKNKILVTIILTAFVVPNVYSQNFPLKLSRVGPNQCETRVQVKDERPSDCVFNGNYYFFPVFVEEFDHKKELPNNWVFNLGGTLDDAFEGNGNGYSWMGDPYGNGNVYTDNGVCFLEVKKEPVYGQANSNVNPKNYDFTNGLLKSIFRMRQGVFEAKMKLPENPHFWPAFWLNGKQIDQEIDIFEFFDSQLNGNACDTYHQMKMTLHHRNLQGSNTSCSRSRKFPVHQASPNSNPPDFFDNYHIFKCVWTDYRIEIYLDNTLVSYATKYYDGPYTMPSPCYKNSVFGLPWSTRDCNYMSNAQACDTYVGWPLYKCIKWNKVDKDESFPTTTSPMTMIIDNIINYNQQNVNASLMNSWSNFSPVNKKLGIDWIKIYQPFNCNAFLNPSTINDIKSMTGSSNFLTGSTIEIGNTNNSAYFINSLNFLYTGDEFPLHILANDEIRINGDAIFEEGTFLRAEIVDCSTGFNQYQRTLPGGEKLYLSDEEIAELEKKQNDSILAANPSIKDSILEYQKRDNESLVYNVKSSIDNGAIVIFPNPVTDKLFVDMDEEDYYDLDNISVIDNLGRSYPMEKSKILDVTSFSPGFYELKFTFSYGIIIVKGFIKK